MSVGPDDYLPADDQIHPTVGLDAGDVDGVGDLDTDTLRDVLDAINSPDQPDWGDELGAVPIDADGRHLSLPPLDLPGFGDPYDDCGDNMPLFCSDCGHVNVVGRTCRNSDCPRCGAAWVRDRAINVSSRLVASRAALDATSDEHQRFHHLAISPPDDWKISGEDPLDATFQVIYDLMDALGLQGYAFYHPYSGDTEAGEDDRGKWRDRLFEGREWQDVVKELEVRPHFHVVGIAHEVPGGRLTEEMHDRTDWIIKRITQSETSNVSIYDNEDLASVVSYCISHTGLRAGENQTTVQYRPHGEAVHPRDGVDVMDSTRLEMDETVRRVVPRTLGLSLGSQLCTEERLQVVDGEPDIRASLISDDGDADRETTADAMDSLAGDVEDMAGGVVEVGSGEEVEGDGDGEDVEKEVSACEGRMLSIKHAEKYLANADWRSEAEHVDDLQTTWVDWKDRLDDLPNAPPDPGGPS